jgi:periplasmic protein TonB
MFDLIATGHRPSTARGFLPLLTSWAIHAIVIGALVVLPLFYATDGLPDAPSELLVFVSPAKPSPPPPPPPAAPVPPRPVPREPRTAPRPAVPAPTPSIPIAPPIEDVAPTDPAFDDEGIFGGVEGGIPGGVIGGVVGGLPDVPLPPPPTAPAPRAPIRTGGALKPPALISRVAPVYPGVAVSARIEGVVILEATVGRDGRVEDVRILRSVPLLDNAAKDAVLQWRYAPLLLNGKAERFILTVTLTFNLS